MSTTVSVESLKKTKILAYAHSSTSTQRILGWVRLSSMGRMNSPVNPTCREQLGRRVPTSPPTKVLNLVIRSVRAASRNLMTDYEPDLEKLVSERVEEYLKTIEEPARPQDIRRKVQTGPTYIYRILTDLHEEGVVKREYGEPVVGHPMPDGGTEVLGSKEKMLGLIERYRKDLLTKARGLGVDELRDLVESEVAVGGSHPLGTRKVWYKYAEEE